MNKSDRIKATSFKNDKWNDCLGNIAYLSSLTNIHKLIINEFLNFIYKLRIIQEIEYNVTNYSKKLRNSLIALFYHKKKHFFKHECIHL